MFTVPIGALSNQKEPLETRYKEILEVGINETLLDIARGEQKRVNESELE